MCGDAWRKLGVSCQVCRSNLNVGDLFSSACGAAVSDHFAAAPKTPPAEQRGRIAGERKYLTVLCVDLQRSTDLISDLDPEEARDNDADGDFRLPPRDRSP
jgi:hypothetical protein